MRGTFTVMVDVGNAAMADADALRGIADKLQAGATDGIVADENGNTVGGFTLQTDDNDPDDLVIVDDHGPTTDADYAEAILDARAAAAEDTTCGTCAGGGIDIDGAIGGGYIPCRVCGGDGVVA